MKLKSLLTNCHKKTVTLNNILIKARKIVVIWNYRVVIELLYTSFKIYELYTPLVFVVSANLMCLIASFKIYELYILLAFVVSANLIYLIVNQWIEIQDLI